MACGPRPANLVLEQYDFQCNGTRGAHCSKRRAHVCKRIRLVVAIEACNFGKKFVPNARFHCWRFCVHDDVFDACDPGNGQKLPNPHHNDCPKLLGACCAARFGYLKPTGFPSILLEASLAAWAHTRGTRNTHELHPPGKVFRVCTNMPNKLCSHPRLGTNYHLIQWKNYEFQKFSIELSNYTCHTLVLSVVSGFPSDFC